MNAHVCLICGKPIPASNGRGRPAEFCAGGVDEAGKPMRSSCRRVQDLLSTDSAAALPKLIKSVQFTPESARSVRSKLLSLCALLREKRTVTRRSGTEIARDKMSGLETDVLIAEVFARQKAPACWCVETIADGASCIDTMTGHEKTARNRFEQLERAGHPATLFELKGGQTLIRAVAMPEEE